jgi:serine/threonine protein kinase
VSGVFTAGDKIGAYTILRRLGAGGMGEVYLAKHRHIGREAAIKLLLPELSAREEVVSRFFTEARATGLLRHPNIVEILDCDVHPSGRAYIVMEFLEGENLGECLARIGSFAANVAMAAAIAGQVAGALAVAHGKGIVHRDLKPDNIFLASTPEGATPINVKVLDFGIAKLAYDGGETKQTRTGVLLGTPIYMSPEQCRGSGRVDHRSDIYSLGCIIFELISGRPPFVYNGAGDLIVAHVSEQPPELSSIVPTAPAALSALAKAMLSKNADERPQSMAEVVKRIEDFLGVGAAQFAAMVAVPPGFPVRGSVDVGASKPPDKDERAIASIPISAGGTKLLPQPQTTFSQTASELASPRPSPPPSGSKAVKAGIAVAVLAGCAAAVFAFRPSRSEGNRSNPPAAIAGPEKPAPVAQVQPPEPPLQKNVTIELENGPLGLSVDLDGRPSSVPVTLPRGSENHLLTFRAPGFKPEVARVDGSRDKTIVLNMQQEATRPSREKLRVQRGTAESSKAKSEEPTSKPTVRKKHDGFTDL